MANSHKRLYDENTLQGENNFLDTLKELRDEVESIEKENSRLESVYETVDNVCEKIINKDSPRIFHRKGKFSRHGTRSQAIRDMWKQRKTFQSSPQIWQKTPEKELNYIYPRLPTAYERTVARLERNREFDEVLAKKNSWWDNELEKQDKIIIDFGFGEENREKHIVLPNKKQRKMGIKTFAMREDKR